MVEPSRLPPSPDLPASVRDVLAVVDLAGKEIGAFYFSPGTGGTVTERIHSYNRTVRETFHADADILFLGDYGDGSVFYSAKGIGLLDLTVEPPLIRALAPNFESFLLVQANAYDAYKRYMVDDADEVGYCAASDACAANVTFAQVDVHAIFERQLKS